MLPRFSPTNTLLALCIFGILLFIYTSSQPNKPNFIFDLEEDVHFLHSSKQNFFAYYLNERPPIYPSFWLALADPDFDIYSRNIKNRGWYEPAIEEVFATILKSRCQKDSLVIDIGANLGVYSALSASYGCKVKSYEVQGRLLPNLRGTRMMNKWSHQRFEINHAGVFDVETEIEVTYFPKPEGTLQEKDWLGASFGNQGHCRPEDNCHVEKVKVMTMNQVLTSDTILMKIDVDGPEGRILRSLLPLLSIYYVESIVMELNPDRWVKEPSNMKIEEVYEILDTMQSELGYHAILLDQPYFSSFNQNLLKTFTSYQPLRFIHHAYVINKGGIRDVLNDISLSMAKNILFTKINPQNLSST